MRPIWWPACVYWPKRLEFTDSLSGSVRYPPCDTVLATVPRTNGREGLTAAVRCAVHDGPVWAGRYIHAALQSPLFARYERSLPPLRMAVSVDPANSLRR